MRQNCKNAACAVVKVSCSEEEAGEGKGPTGEPEAWESPGHWQRPTDQVTNPS